MSTPDTPAATGAGPVAVGPAPEAETPIDRQRIPPLIKRNTLLVASSQAIAGIGMQMVPTLTAIMIERMLQSALLTGLGYSALGVSRFLVAYPLGIVSDRRGRRVALLLGLSTVDAAGNLVGRRPGRRADLPPIVVGSHTDTVTGGGRFDGIVGVLGGLEAVRCLAEAEVELDHPLELIDEPPGPSPEGTDLAQP